MLAAHIALLALVGLTPLLVFFDSRSVDGFVALYAAVALALVAFSIRPGEARHWVKTSRWPAALAVLPILWMIIQLLPLPIGALSGSIWQSAASALGISMWSSISIDPGLTILALCRYASIIGLGAVAAACSIDRQQAERVLFALGAAAVALSLISIVLHIGGFEESVSKGLRAAATTGSVYGVVLSAAVTILIVERHLTRRTLRGFRWQFLVPLAATVASFAICVLATIVAGSEQAIFAAACGFAVVAIIQFVRRIGLDWRAAVAMAGVAVIAAVVIVSTKAHPALADFSMRYAAGVSADDISVANRLVGEVGFGGSGAGTFSAIYRLYASGDSASTSAPTSAAQIAIELGRPMLWVIVASMVALIFLYARGGFNRGRDFFYSIAGAGAGVATLIFAFCDIGLDSMAISILLASTLGLALAQSVSRTI